MFCVVLKTDEEFQILLYQCKEGQFKMIYKRTQDYYQQNLLPFIKIQKTSLLFVITEAKKMICLNIKDKFQQLDEFQIYSQYPITKVFNMEKTIAVAQEHFLKENELKSRVSFYKLTSKLNPVCQQTFKFVETINGIVSPNGQTLVMNCHQSKSKFQNSYYGQD